jgi:hypothetical protein
MQASSIRFVIRVISAIVWRNFTNRVAKNCSNEEERWISVKDLMTVIIGGHFSCNFCNIPVAPSSINSAKYR